MRSNPCILLLVLLLSGCLSIQDSASGGDIRAVRSKVTPETVNSIDRFGRTPLMSAAVFCRVDVGRLLIEKGADPNMKGTSTTALVKALGSEYCEDRRVAMVRLLISAGADVNARSVYAYAQDGAMRWMKSASPLSVAMIEGDAWAVNFLLESGADPRSKSPYGANVLHDVLAYPRASRSSASAVATFISALQRTDPVVLATLLTESDRLFNFTPLHYAAKNGDETMMRILVAAGADPHAKSRSGLTAIEVLDSHLKEEAIAQENRRAQRQSSGGGAAAFFQGLMTTAAIVSDPTGRAYNDHVVATIPGLAPLAEVANAKPDHSAVSATDAATSPAVNHPTAAVVSSGRSTSSGAMTSTQTPYKPTKRQPCPMEWKTGKASGYLRGSENEAMESMRQDARKSCGLDFTISNDYCEKKPHYKEDFLNGRVIRTALPDRWVCHADFRCAKQVEACPTRPANATRQ